MLTQGIADDEARRGLTEEAAQQHASCCPWCYGLVPVPREVPPLLLNRYRGRLSAGGYRVEVSERGLRTSLEIVTPTAQLYRGREQGQLWTRRGAMILFVGPLILLALLWALGAIGFGIKPLTPRLWRAAASPDWIDTFRAGFYTTKTHKLTPENGRIQRHRGGSCPPSLDRAYPSV